MTTYSITHPEKGLIQFKDKKRWLWLSALVWSVLPLAIMALFLNSGNPWMLVLPILLVFILVPLLDYVFGIDTSNPPEEIVPLLDADPFYRRLLIAAIPLHFIVVIAGAWLAGTQSLPIGFFIAFAAMLGIYSGSSINTAHEIGHKNTKLERFLSRVVLAVTGYGHFCVEHNLGHHRDVSTPGDPASSRMGESIYRFMLREIPGAAKRGWNAEAKRLEKRDKSFLSTDNHILQSYGMTLIFQGGLIALFGWILVPFFLIHNFFAWFQLTSANYIEHYGLLREKKPNGKYERCQPHHSWNANHIVSNLLLFQLERHSDHHANPARRYQSLRSFADLPELPSGYSGMYALAYCPPLWFAVMDKRVMAVPHINGDLSKVNIDPKSEAKLRAKWG
ncbi:MAG: alkane 1-monooxygenase [Arenicella sp.]|jgi:alkane 1-monooxygenase